MSNQEGFTKEDRYIVIKRSDLDKIPSQRVVHAFLASLAEVSAHSCRIPQRKFVVVESDWPEYKIVWQMIEARISGKPADFDALAADNQRLREALIAASKAYSKAELGLIVDAALAGSKGGE